MNENETMEETTEEVSEAAAETSAETEVTAETEAQAEEGEETAAQTEEAAETEGAEESAPSAESFAKTLANPMFAVFARGRSGGIEEAVRDFEKMLSAGRSALSEEELMKMTPGAGFAAGSVALSERQRKIARDAGMSYREYYEIIRSIPTKK